MKLIIYRGAIALVLLVLVQSCYKIDVDWLNKRKDKDQFYFLPEEFTQRGIVWFKSYFKGNNPHPYKIFMRTWGGDDSLLMDIKWLNNYVIFTVKEDTCFKAELNSKGQVVKVIPGNYSLYADIPFFRDEMVFFYENDKVSKITFSYDRISDFMNLQYSFTYDQFGNCNKLQFENIDFSSIIDLGLYEYDHYKKVNSQFYFFSNDILTRDVMQVLDFIGLIPGMQPKSLKIVSRLSSYHDVNLTKYIVQNQKFDKYNNLIDYEYLSEYYDLTPTSIQWKKFKK